MKIIKDNEIEVQGMKKKTLKKTDNLSGSLKK